MLLANHVFLELIHERKQGFELMVEGSVISEAHYGKIESRKKTSDNPHLSVQDIDCHDFEGTSRVAFGTINATTLEDGSVEAIVNRILDASKFHALGFLYHLFDLVAVF